MPAINPQVLDDLGSLQTPGAPSFLGELIDLFLKAELEAERKKL